MEASRQPQFRGWLVLIGVFLGLIGGSLLVLWQHSEGSFWERLRRNSPLTFRHIPQSEVGQPAEGRDQGRPSDRGVVPRSTEHNHAASGHESLFAALGVHRPSEPSAAIDFSLPDLDGRPVQLREFRGKLVLLNFWATWCAPCLHEMPSMERLYQTFKETDFVLLAVSMDRQGAEAAKPYVKNLQLTFPVLVDHTNEIGRQYGVRGLPSTYLIDPDGRLIGAVVGARDWHRAEAKALIAGILRHASGQTTAPLQVHK